MGYALNNCGVVWWLRAASSANNFRNVNNNGTDSTGRAYNDYGVALGFGVGSQSRKRNQTYARRSA